MQEASERQDSSRPYHAKRPHRKSRTGCRQCKVRKVKCDEGRPSCRNCTLRKETCVYPVAARASASQSPKAQSTELAVVTPQRSASANDLGRSAAVAQMLDEPLFAAPGRDATDMKLLWFWTTKAYESFTTEGAKDPIQARQDILKITIVQFAFDQPFLMNAILGVAALNMDALHLNETVARPRSILYRARAFEGYRQAIQKADPRTYPALLASSLFLCALASQVFREPDPPPFYMLDWIMCWRGIGLIFDLIRREGAIQSGLAGLFVRPAIDLEAAASHIPSNLLFMITSIANSDEEISSVPVYYETLKFLGSLYQELQIGFSPILELRIVTFFTFVNPEFIDLARKKRPRALVIVAHYCIFTKLVTHVWWMEGIGDRDIRDIVDFLGDAWQSELRVPHFSLELNSKQATAQLLLNNHAWQGSPEDLFAHAHFDQRMAKLGLVDDYGKELILPGNFTYRPLEGSESTEEVAQTPSSGSAGSPSAPQFPYLPSVEDSLDYIFPEDD
jgi:hypothetical protein